MKKTTHFLRRFLEAAFIVALRDLARHLDLAVPSLVTYIVVASLLGILAELIVEGARET